MNLRSDIAALWCAVLCGSLAGWWLGTQHAENPPSSTPPNRREMSSRRLSNITNQQEKHNFKSALARFKLSGSLPEAAMSTLEHANSAELHEWLLSIAAEPIDDRDVYARMKRYKILKALAHELYQREGKEAVRWADGIHNERLLINLLAEMGRDDFASAMSWIPAYLEKYQSPTNPLFDAAAQEAAMRSADELLKMEEEYSDANIIQFADNFDFNKYLESTKSEISLITAIRYWAALDPDATAKALHEKIGPKYMKWKRAYSEAYQARAITVGAAEAAHWIWPVLSELSAGDKLRIYPSILSNNTVTNLALFHTIPDDAARVDFLALAMPAMGNNNGVCDLLRN